MAGLFDILGPAASVLGAGAALLGSSKQASAIRDSTAESTALQRQMFDINRADLQPWREAGEVGLQRLLDPEASFAASPGYQFRLDEGRRAVDHGAAARGLLGSGSRLRALMELGQNLGSQEYGNWWNQQAGLAGIGQAATQQGVSAGQNMAANVGNAIQQGGSAAGTALGGGYVGAGNALMGGVNNYLFYDYLRNRPPSVQAVPVVG